MKKRHSWSVQVYLWGRWRDYSVRHRSKREAKLLRVRCAWNAPRNWKATRVVRVDR